MSEEENKRPTAHLIVEHLREFKEQARVFVGCQKQELSSIVNGALGLLTLYKDELAGIDPRVGLKHSDGGTIRFFYPEPPSIMKLEGRACTLMIIENLDAIAEEHHGDLIRSLIATAQDAKWYESEDCLYLVPDRKELNKRRTKRAADDVLSIRLARR